jgi:hypothetical protein
MAGRPRKTTSIEEDIARQEEIVSKTKQKYDEAVSKLKDLYAKKDEQRKKELFAAVEKSSKTYDEIMTFLQEEK